ncbi:MAG: hypothetical protein OXG85_16745 [Chloroflexi bacterium]|nr:hypothetical protein [Chloroflexota bacterium]
MIRFARAFFQALRLTLRGESLPGARYKPLETWIAQGLTLLETAEKLSVTEHVSWATLRLKLDGRPTSLDTTLAMLRHNLVDEYPRLMRLDDPHSLTVIQSSNLNDQYRVDQFAEADAVASPALRRALAELSQHLSNLPSIATAETDA